MITGIGVDICDLNRLKNLDKLARTIMHPLELEIYASKKTERQKLEFVGGRFAAKEAYMKAVGIVPFKEICCLNDENGKPYFLDSTCMISISHEVDYAIAFAVAQTHD